MWVARLFLRVPHLFVGFQGETKGKTTILVA